MLQGHGIPPQCWKPPPSPGAAAAAEGDLRRPCGGRMEPTAERPEPGREALETAAGGQSRAERSGHLRSAPPEQPPSSAAAGAALRIGAEGQSGARGPRGREPRTRLVGLCPAACAEGVLGDRKKRGAF